MKKWFGLVLLLLVGTFASADTLQLVSAPYGVNGPYLFSANGGPGTTPLICFSDANYVTIGETWTVQAYTIATVGSITGAFAGTVAQYNAIGYLADQLFANPGNADLQSAIWAVLTTGVENSKYTQALNYVAAHPEYHTASVFYIPVGDFSNRNIYPYGVPQPFVGRVPEPASILLLGSGLLAIVSRKKRQPAIN
jgi:PEP-CTERM motif